MFLPASETPPLQPAPQRNVSVLLLPSFNGKKTHTSLIPNHTVNKVEFEVQGTVVFPCEKNSRNWATWSTKDGMRPFHV